MNDVEKEIKNFEHITFAEYIWIGGSKSDIRSKTKVLDGKNYEKPEDFPMWNFDGSSTNQAVGTDSEVELNPVAVYKDPFRGMHHKLVLCETIDSKTRKGHPSNSRRKALTLFNQKKEEKPWYGIEQEFFFTDTSNTVPIAFAENENRKPQGPYYCSIGSENNIGRQILEEFLFLAIYCGLKISGINAEVAPSQWEFQVGPCEGIDAGDQLWMSRFLITRVCEKYSIGVNFHPKPIQGDWNGSGCHTNFSTESMRNEGGFDVIKKSMKKLEKKHKLHMSRYGSGNELRMTGEHETSDYNTFNWGVANRGCSIRIPRQTERDGKGYFEDRRPSSNMDPYIVTSLLFKTVCLEDDIPLKL